MQLAEYGKIESSEILLAILILNNIIIEIDIIIPFFKKNGKKK